MATITAFAANHSDSRLETASDNEDILAAILRLHEWLERNDYSAYDTFDGLSSKLLRPLTFEAKFLRQVLLQAVRRFPINLRPMIGIPKERSSKGMGYIAKGFIRLHQATGDPRWAEKAHLALRWLIDHRLTNYSGSCWGNHFDYDSRVLYIPRGVPTVVWTGLIGHAFMDAYQHFGNEEYLAVSQSICEHIVGDLRRCQDGDSVCINYIPGPDCWVHNSNGIGSSFLARVGAANGNCEYLELARKSMQYTARHQRPDGAWYYGEKSNHRWVDNFHTGYVLDCFKHYSDSTGDRQFDGVLAHGYEYWKRCFFLQDGMPRYYDNRTYPLDIQCASQGIDTLVLFSTRDKGAIPLALAVARWTIAHMQDASGYFYYRRYKYGVVNKTPTLHWGQATMFSALTGLLRNLLQSECRA